MFIKRKRIILILSLILFTSIFIKEVDASNLIDINLLKQKSENKVKVVDTEAPTLDVDEDAFINFSEQKTDQELKDLFNVSANDNVDGDITKDITVDQSDVKYDIPGTYKVNFSISDSSGNNTNKDVNLTIYVDIPDENLKKALNEEYNTRFTTTRPDDQNFTVDELGSFRGKLELLDKNIVDTKGLEYVKNISDLNISNNSISDISFLYNMHLTSFKASSNKIENIKPLESQKNMLFISMGDNKVKDVSPLKNINYLNGCYMENNEITDLSPIKDLRGANFRFYNQTIVLDDSSNEFNHKGFPDLSVYDKNANEIKLSDYKKVEGTDNYQDTWKSGSFSGTVTLENYHYEENQEVDLNSPNFDLEDNKSVNLHEIQSDEDIKTLFNISNINDNKDNLNIDDIKVDQSDVKYDIPGNYKVKFTLIDSDSNQTNKEVNLEVIDPIIYMPDDNLRNALNESYFSQAKDADITQTQMEGLDVFSSSSEISDITGLGYAKNLTSLSLANNKINDIMELSELSNLKDLNLYKNQISDISSLSGLINLVDLNLSNNQISDISPLSGLTSLNDLYLSENQISDLTPINGLTNLNTLKLDSNQISDISPLSGLTSLNTLHSSMNQISDISVLSGLTNLYSLNLSSNEIIDISALSGLTSLNDLYLSNNKISDISPLSGLINLKTLEVSSNQVNDFTSLRNLSILEIDAYNQEIIKDFASVGKKEIPTFSIYDIDGIEYKVDMGDAKQGVYDYTGSWDLGLKIKFSGTVTYTNYKYDTEAPDLKFDDNISTPAQKTLSDDELKSLFNVSAIDFVEGDLTTDVVVDQSAVNYDVPGNYKVTFSVTDPTGNSISKDANLEVKTLYPIISADNIYTNVDSISGVDIDEFLLNNANISVGETTKKLNDVVVKSTDLTNDSKVGIYDVTFEVSNDFLESASTDIKVYVANGSDIIDDTNPYIFANSISVDAGSKIDNSLYGAVAFDKDDGDLTSSINYPTVDTSTTGKKVAKLSVSDKSGNNSEISVNVDVIDNIKPVIVASDSSEIELNSTLSSDEAKKLFNVSVSDNVDNLTIDDVSVDMSGVDLNTVGTYDIVFSVSDKSSNSTTKISKLSVIDSDVPIINSLDKVNIKAKNPLSDDELKTLFKLAAIDNYDGDITSDVDVDQTKVNYDVPGFYDVVFSVVDSNGNRADKKVFLKILSNEPPVLKGVEDIEVIDGSDFDPMEGVIAIDKEDGDISNNIEVYSKDLKDGLTQVYNYSIEDSDGNKVEVNRTVKYVSVTNNKPVINGIDNTNIFVGEDFDPMDGVSASDIEDGDLTSSISISGSVNNNVIGDYTLTYTVVDSDNNTVSIDRIITVKDIVVITNNKPIISGANDVKVKLGSDFDIMKGISASDVEDGDITSLISINGKVNTSIVGDYTLTYSVVDSDNNKVKVTRTISVYDDENNVINNIYGNDNNSVNNNPSSSKNLISTGKSSIYFLVVSVLSFVIYFIQIKKVNIMK